MIIKRLQEFDKLKQIVFNDYQRFFFELIPKPQYSPAPAKANNLPMSSQNGFMNKSRSNLENFVSDNDFIERFENLRNIPSQISNRILFLLDESVKKSYEELTASKKPYKFYLKLY
jgi:hypothetical protein